jgi:putative two-component system response regulator
VLAVELDATLGRFAADSLLRYGGRILLLGDDLAKLQQVERLLVEAGFGPVTINADRRRMLALFQDFKPDVVLLDLEIHGVDPSQIIRQLGARVPDAEFLPIVVIAAAASPEQKQSLLSLGVCDIIDREIGLSDLPLRLQNVLRIRDLSGALEQRVAARTALLRETELELASRLAAVAELGDYGDASHVQRVGRTSALLAAQLGVAPDEVLLIRHAAPLHDIGKIAIPEAILLKSDPLTLEEWDVLKTHTTIGARLLAGSLSPVLQVAEKIALYHHECWDGTGYTGISGEDIPFVGRIVTVADVFDALTHERPFKSAWTSTDSVEWMQTMRGQRFDPHVFDALAEVLHTTDLTDLGADALPLLGTSMEAAAEAVAMAHRSRSPEGAGGE